MEANEGHEAEHQDDDEAQLDVAEVGRHDEDGRGGAEDGDPGDVNSFCRQVFIYYNDGSDSKFS